MAFLKKRGAIWYVYWSQDGTKHGKSLRTKSKQVAEEYLRELDYRLAKRELRQQTDVSLARLSDEYLDYAKSTKTATTYCRHDVPRVARFMGFLEEHGLTKASQIRETHVQKYQQQLIGKFSAHTVRHCMYAASGLLSFAVRRGYLTSNVVKNVSKVKAQQNPPRYLSYEEWDKVRQVARKTYLSLLVATAYYTGFRNSELRHLTWEEIDFERDVITLRNKPGFSLKNRESRTVPLSHDLRTILEPLRRDKGYCFTNAVGLQFKDYELTAEFKRLIVKPSGLPHFCLHSLRHTFASHLVMKGVSIYKVSQWLGHKSVNTTMIYAHLAPQDDEINVLSAPRDRRRAGPDRNGLPPAPEL